MRRFADLLKMLLGRVQVVLVRDRLRVAEPLAHDVGRELSVGIVPNRGGAQGASGAAVPRQDTRKRCYES